MSTNFPLRQTLRAVQKRMNADFLDATSQINHRGAKGRERESSVVEQYLKVYMPKTVNILHGAEIVDSTGTPSLECDIALVDPSTPPLYSGETFQVVPVEWAHGIIEVKSKLDSVALRDAHKKIVRAKTLQKVSYEYDLPGFQLGLEAYGQIYKYFPLYGAVFAFSGIRLETLADTLWDLQKDTPVSEWIDLVVVLDQGLLVYSDRKIVDGKSIHGRPGLNSVLRVIKSRETITQFTMYMQAVFSYVLMPHASLSPYFGPERDGTYSVKYWGHNDTMSTPQDSSELERLYA